MPSCFTKNFTQFQQSSRTMNHFPGISSPRKCHSKIPGLSRISRTRTNPVLWCFMRTYKAVFKVCLELSILGFVSLWFVLFAVCWYFHQRRPSAVALLQTATHSVCPPPGPVLPICCVSVPVSQAAIINKPREEELPNTFTQTIKLC